MRKTSWILTSFLLSLDARATELLLRNVTVISAERSIVAAPQDVLISDGLIAKIGINLVVGADGETMDATGLFLTPGLIDGHTHLDEIPGMIPEQEAKNPEVAREARHQIPRSYLYHGFTTVIDLNSRPEPIADWNKRDIRPHAYFCGAAPVVDGYPMRWIPKPRRYQIMPYFLFDPEREEDFPQEFERQHHSPERVAARIHEDGGICIKTHHERGFGGRGTWPVPTLDLGRRLKTAARELGMPLLLHASSTKAQAFGVDIGADALVHGMWTWSQNSEVTLPADVTAVLQQIVNRGIAVQPAIQVLYGERDLHDPGYLSRESLSEVLPASLIRWYSTTPGQWWRNRMASRPAVETLLTNHGWESLDAQPIARVVAAVGYLFKHGGHLSFGSDTPSDPTYANPPGLNGRLEMERWVQAGVPAAAIFQAATWNNARLFGLHPMIGTVEVGKRADLILMQSNPLRSVAAYDTIKYVILGGRLIPRGVLAANATD